MVELNSRKNRVSLRRKSLLTEFSVAVKYRKITINRNSSVEKGL